MGWLKSISVGIKIVFGRKIEVSPTVSVAASHDDLDRLLNHARRNIFNEGSDENRISGDREGTEDNHDQGRKD